MSSQSCGVNGPPYGCFDFFLCMSAMFASSDTILEGVSKDDPHYSRCQMTTDELDAISPDSHTFPERSR